MKTIDCVIRAGSIATLASLASEDPRFTPVADTYWNARGGSYTDGGAFLLTVSPNGRLGLRPDQESGGGREQNTGGGQNKRDGSETRPTGVTSPRPA